MYLAAVCVFITTVGSIKVPFRGVHPGKPSNVHGKSLTLQLVNAKLSSFHTILSYFRHCNLHLQVVQMHTLCKCRALSFLFNYNQLYTTVSSCTWMFRAIINSFHQNLFFPKLIGLCFGLRTRSEWMDASTKQELLLNQIVIFFIPCISV